MEIPPGETVSYAQLSHSLGHPKAARAMARACASNRLAVLVPCHRVFVDQETWQGTSGVLNVNKSS